MFIWNSVLALGLEADLNWTEELKIDPCICQLSGQLIYFQACLLCHACCEHDVPEPLVETLILSYFISLLQATRRT